MAGDRTYPILPCVDVDEIITFYELLGFKKTYRQLKPYACAIVERCDIGLHFFGMPNFKPADSYGSCILTMPDADELYRAFAAGLRAKFGKLPAAGIPRMTRPTQAATGGVRVQPDRPGRELLTTLAVESVETPVARFRGSDYISA